MSVITETKPITDNMTYKEKLILENFKELERMKREIFKTTMQVIICNENLSQTTYNQCSMNVLRLQIRE